MKVKEKYYITQEQLDTIRHYKEMFRNNAETLKTLCSSEKSDIEYGFELGNMNTHLMQCFIALMELEDEIKSQVIKQ